MKSRATLAAVAIAFGLLATSSGVGAQPAGTPVAKPGPTVPASQPKPTVPASQPSATPKPPAPRPVKPVPKPVPKPVDSADAKALALYTAGDAAYAAGKYSLAAAKFRAAYELSGRPQLLFNMANAYQQMGRYADAAESLNNYVSHAEPQERAAIRSRIAVLRHMAEVGHARAGKLRQLEARLFVDEAERNSGKRWAYTAWVGGAFALGLGVVFAERASDSADDALRDCVDTGGDPVCLSSARPRFRDERNHALVADISFGVGLVAVAAGVYLYLRAQSKERRARDLVRARIGPVMTGVDVGFHF